MNFLRSIYAKAPEYPRVAPYAVLVLLSWSYDQVGLATYWLYAIKTVLAAWLLWEARPFAAEMRWRISGEAVAVGGLIFLVWIGLDGYYPRLGKLGTPWNPHQQFGENSGAAWFFVLIHLAGSTIVVPPAEELFYRSFIYRYLVKIDFQAMPLSQFHPLSFAVTSIFFGLVHPDRWVAGIICGLGYQWLVVRNNRLGDAITAHAITNFLLGVWVISRQAWSFW